MAGASPKPPIATRPLEKVGMEIYSIHGSDYLITTDYLSSFTEVYDLKKDTKAQLLIKEMKNLFSSFGVPVEIFSYGSCARHLNILPKNGDLNTPCYLHMHRRTAKPRQL